MRKNMDELVEYVSIDTAKALKKAGFDWETDHWFEVLNDGKVMYPCGFETNWNNPCYGESTISRPTLKAALKWLNDTKSKHVVVISFKSKETNERGWKQGYVAGFCDINENKFLNPSNWDGFDGPAYETFEEALDFGIYSSLKTNK